MSHRYCTEAEFYRYAPEAAPFLNARRPIYGWGAAVSTIFPAYGTGTVTVLFQGGVDLGAAQSVVGDLDTEGEWFYDSTTDKLSLYTATDPNTLLMEAGEDKADYILAIRAQVSGIIDSLLDAKHQTPVPKDKSGNYDEAIIQATAYKWAEVITQGRNPEMSEMYRLLLQNPEKTGIIDGINGGWIKLRSEVEVTSSKGEISEVGSISGGVHLTRSGGSYTGSRHDLLKIVISTTGVEGTGKFKVFVYDENNDLSKNLEITQSGGEIINFFRQFFLGNGLWIMFEGDDGDSATSGDEWELEVWGRDAEVTNPGFRTMQGVRY